MPATLPIGDLIAHLRGWTDKPLGQFLALVRGSAPESAGSYGELSRLAAALRGNEAALAILSDGSVSFSPEFESCRQIANEKQLALKEIYDAAMLAFRSPPATP